MHMILEYKLLWFGVIIFNVVTVAFITSSVILTNMYKNKKTKTDIQKPKTYLLY